MNAIYLLLTLILLISLFLASQLYVEPFINAQLFSQIENERKKYPTNPPGGLDTTYKKYYDSSHEFPTYHSDPEKNNSTSTNNLEFGYVWVQNAEGNLVATKLDVIQNKTQYYPFGSSTPNPPPFVPNYEESVWLSRKSNPRTETKEWIYSSLLPYNEATGRGLGRGEVGPMNPYTYKPFNMNKIDPANLCSATEGSIINREFECSKLNQNECHESECCTSLGERQCVPNLSYKPT
jgi:hypothetical protein|uniref:Uncharacterized protein n=1 Tax=viral metagenome TaxID=1070528 RepID=A0A6C0DY19_9ZZZZ